MKQIIIALLLIPSMTCVSQFAPVGATWFYNTQEQILEYRSGYTKYTVVKDTIIESKSMKMISVEEYSYFGNVINQPDRFLFIDQLRVYEYSFNQLDLLFDFSLVPGDTLKLNLPENEFCVSVTPIILDSIGNIQFDNSELLIQYFSYSETYFTGDTIDIVYPIVEKIGTLDYFMKRPYCSYESSMLNQDLRCYQDNEISYTALWWYNEYGDNNCDLLISDLQNFVTVDPNICIYPNPVSEILFIDSDKKNYSVSIYDLLGREVIHSLDSKILDLSILSHGPYLLIISDEIHCLLKQILIKE